MTITIEMDASGRLVLPKALRQKLNLQAGVRLRAGIVAGKIELTPVAGEQELVLSTKSGIAVLKRTGTKVDAAAAVSNERDAVQERGLRQ